MPFVLSKVSKEGLTTSWVGQVAGPAGVVVDEVVVAQLELFTSPTQWKHWLSKHFWPLPPSVQAVSRLDQRNS